MASRRRTLAIAVAVLGSAGSSASGKQALQVLIWWQQGGSDVVSLLSGLLGAVVASPLVLGVAPAVLAADKTPGQLEAYGLNGKRAKDVNGLWSVFPDKKVNGRAVYKKDDADIYLTYSDCQQFQMVKKPTGECEGFALEYKGVWEVDGQDTRMKVKPYQSKEDRKKAQQKGGEQPSGGGGFFQLGKIEPIIPKQESDAEVLLNGQDVNEYVRRKGSTGMMGMQDYLTNMMTLEEEESKIADSLEARLDAKLKDRDISKVKPRCAQGLPSRRARTSGGMVEKPISTMDEGQDSLVMAEAATGEAAVPEDSGDEFQEDADEQGLEDEDLEEEEPEDDEEIAPGHLSSPGQGGGASKNDTLDMLADMSELSGFGASGKSASASHSRRAGSFSRVGGAGSATASRRSAEDSRHEDAEDVVLAREAVKWLLQKIYRRCDNSKLDKVPDLMTRCEGKEVLLLHSALRKYVPMPRDEEIDSFGQTVEDKADLLQELLMGLADHFGVDAPAAVDLSNLGNSFLQELYQMLSHVKAEVVAMATV
ncbi:unnamed protein product [Symbiodinium sp. KB8]|nr:unnamed protein product [Symbiodinium sp. KB8]